MSFASLLIHWCGIEQDLGGAADAYGNEAEDWQDVVGLEDFPCRLMSADSSRQGQRKEILVGAEVVIADYKLFLDDETPDGVPVLLTEQNRVHVWVRDTSGAWILNTYEVLMVNNIQNGVDEHHKECWLKTVR